MVGSTEHIPKYKSILVFQSIQNIQDLQTAFLYTVHLNVETTVALQTW